MTKSTEAGAAVRFPPPVVFVVAAGAGAALQLFAYPWFFRLPRAASTALGIVAIAAGIWLGSQAIGLFRKTGQRPAPWTPTPELIFAGPYRWTRNPMYVGMTGITFGVGLLANCVWIAVLALVGLGVVHHIAVKPEEAYLRGKFGAAYEEYLGRVGRYL